MATGLLPFDDDNLQTLLRKIVTQEVAYPSFLSPALVDLLKRMLTKNPELRITLPEIKEHDWFSQTQYAALFAMHLGERSTEAIVDAALVEQMTRMGIETATLRQQLLLGAFTELTSVYRMLRRQRLTDSMRDVVASLPTTSRRLPTPHPFPRDEHRLGVVRVRPVAVPHTQSPTGAAKPTAAAPRIATMPAPIGPRRFSRPLAINRVNPTGRELIGPRGRLISAQMSSIQ
jgi:hypothetical protein